VSFAGPLAWHWQSRGGRANEDETWGGPGRNMSGYLQNFDLTQGVNILRLICGLFFIPHIYAKFFVPEALGFFVAAKFRPPAAWMYTACVIETFLAIGLIFAIVPVLAGALGFMHLLVAGGAVWKVTKGKWLWNIGGYEYCLFWAICCLIVAMHYGEVG
jgi:putative oxidoreductase